MDLFRKRRERLLSLAHDYGTMVAIRPENIFYLTDFWGGAFAVVEIEKTVLITSRMEGAAASKAGKDVNVVAVDSLGGMYEAVKERLKGKPVVDAYDPRLRGCKIDGGIFLQARRKKDSQELARIAEASRRIDRIYCMLERTIRLGMTERQVAARVMKLATEEGLTPLGAEGSLDPIIVASGANGSYPHAGITDRRIREGDLVVADIFFRFKGYCSDCTRTFAVGRASKEQKKNYDAVLEAQLRGIETAQRGVSCREVHEAVVEVLRSFRLERYFTHGTGHGVGVQIHEAPRLAGKSNDTLQEGDVVTVEPGVYLEGRYGIRIEDTLAIGRETRNLHRSKKEFLVIV